LKQQNNDMMGNHKAMSLQSKAIQSAETKPS
jgi:hypothetical protein